MNPITAKAMMHEAATLVEQVATFEARYGRGMTMRPGSPAEAWTLHDAIRDTLNRIACYLDPTALEVTQFKHGPWWERQDVMDTATAAEIVNQVAYLMTCTVYCTEQSRTDWSYTALNVQRVIAGLLPHTARMVAADDAHRVSHRGSA